MEKQDLYIYVRFPFCPGNCVFCDDRTYGENITDATRYRTALEKEIKSAAGELTEYNIKSVHVGGGALGTLGYGSMDNFLDKLQRIIPAENSKWMVDLLPSEINEMNLQILRQRGISKIALGVMGTTKEELKALHRPYTVNLVEHALGALKNAPDMQVSAEPVFGIPGQTPEMFSSGLQRLTDCGFGEIRLTRFHDKTKTPREQREYAEETDWHSYIAAAETQLTQLGYARDGKKLIFVREGEGFEEYHTDETACVMGFGVGAVTRLDGLSYHNTPRLKDYFEHSDNFEQIAILE